MLFIVPFILKIQVKFKYPSREWWEFGGLLEKTYYSTSISPASAWALSTFAIASVSVDKAWKITTMTTGTIYKITEFSHGIPPDQPTIFQ